MGVVKHLGNAASLFPTENKGGTGKQKPKRKVFKKSPVANGAKVTPPVLVDDRAGSRDLVKHPPLDKAGVLCRLDSGDVAFQGNGPNGKVHVGVEVKSITDLIASGNTGRLQATQIPAMKAEYDYSYLLVYGSWRPNPSGSGVLQTRSDPLAYFYDYHIGSQAVLYGWVEGLLNSLSAAGVLVRRVGLGPMKEGRCAEASAWLGVLARWWGKGWGEHKAFHTFDGSREVSSLNNSIDTHTLQIAEIASKLPGVGYERAMAVAAHFDSVTAMVGAEAGEWAEIVTVDAKTGKSRRLGPVTAAGIVAALRKSVPFAKRK